MNIFLRWLSGLALIFSLVTGAAAQDLYGEWSGTVDQVGPGNQTGSYPVRMIIDGTQGEIDYPSLGCGGLLTFQNRNGNVYFYVEHLSYGRDKCIDGGMVAVQSDGNSVNWAWNVSGVAVSGVLNGSWRLPSCNECDVNRSRCYTGCDNTYPNLIEREGCNNRCRADYLCVMGSDCQ